jgi:hypothetical protein
MGAFPVYYLFPNVQVNVGAENVTLVRVYPDKENPSRSFSRISFYARPGALEAEGSIVRDLAVRFGAIIRDEDYVAAASTGRGAQAGLVEHFLFGRNEPALHHYHKTYREALGLPELELVAA